MTVDDYVHIATEMAEKLRSSRFLVERSSQSPELVFAVNKVQNLSSDIISVPTQWYMQERVVNSLPLAALSREKNISFVMPAEKVRGAKAALEVDEHFGADRRPTHVMSATFRSVTRSAGKDRTDLYYSEYAIADLSSGEIVWTDKVEFKRAAHGVAWD